MNLRVLVGILLVSVVGCAQTHAPRSPLTRALPPAEMAPLPSIGESINRTPKVSSYKQLLPPLPRRGRKRAVAAQAAPGDRGQPVERYADEEVAPVIAPEDGAAAPVLESTTPPASPLAAGPDEFAPAPGALPGEPAGEPLGASSASAPAPAELPASAELAPESLPPSAGGAVPQSGADPSGPGADSAASLPELPGAAPSDRSRSTTDALPPQGSGSLENVPATTTVDPLLPELPATGSVAPVPPAGTLPPERVPASVPPVSDPAASPLSLPELPAAPALDSNAPETVPAAAPAFDEAAPPPMLDMATEPAGSEPAIPALGAPTADSPGAGPAVDPSDALIPPAGAGSSPGTPPAASQPPLPDLPAVDAPASAPLGPAELPALPQPAAAPADAEDTLIPPTAAAPSEDSSVASVSRTTRDAAKPALSDPSVQQASADASAPIADAAARAEAEIESGSALRTNVSSGQLLGMSVATVGGEPISRHQLQRALDEFTHTRVDSRHRLTPGEINQLAENILEDLIDRTLVIQEAKRTFLKSEKQVNAFNLFADNRWREVEYPKLLRKHNVKTEHELNEVLKRSGRSVKSLMEAYRTDQLKTEFVRGRLNSRLRAGYPELKAYYQAHIREYDRPAQVTWREIVIKTGNAGDSGAARQKAAQVLARIRAGEDFGALARTVSQGPTAADGGKRVTEPSASAVPAINSALQTFASGQVSDVLEGPGGFYIVRLDDRRAAGPAPFPEVQKEVQEAWLEENWKRELTSYLKKLRSQTIITYWRDENPPSVGGPAKRVAQTR